MKTEDILNMNSDEVSKLTLKELRQVTQQLIHVEQVRMNRLSKSGVETPAVKSYDKIKDTLTTKDKTLNEVRSIFYQAKYQLGLKTSTLRGAKDVMKRLNERLGGQSSEIDIDAFWRIYNKFQESQGTSFKYTGDSNKIQKILYQMSKDYGDFDEEFILEELDRVYTEMYEDEEEDGFFILDTKKEKK